MAIGKKNNIKKIFLTLLSLIWLPVAAQNSWNMVNGDTLFINGCAYNTGFLYDDGGPSGNYTNYFEGWAVIQTGGASTITLTGSYVTESSTYDWIDVWDGDANSGTLIVDRAGGTGTLTATATSGTMTIHFRSDGSVVRSGFELTYTVLGGYLPEGVTGLTTTGITATGATLSWSSTGSGPYHVLLDGVELDSTMQTTYTLNSLHASRRYDVTVYPENLSDNTCSYGRTQFRTACGLTTMPIVEDFNDLAVGVMPPCWTSSVNFDDAETQPQVTENQASERYLMLSCGSNNTNGHYGIVMSPIVNHEGNVWTISFDYRVSHDNTRFEIGVCDSTSTEQQQYGFTVLDYLYTSNNTEWHRYRQQLTIPAGACRLAFRMVQSGQNGVGRITYIDNLSVEDCGISEAWVTRTDTSSTMVGWTALGTPTVSIGVRHEGAMADEFVISADSMPQLVTGLTPDTRYTLTLYPVCDGNLHIPYAVTVQTLPAIGMPTSLCDNPADHSNYPYILKEGWSGYNCYPNYSNVTLYNNSLLVTPPIADLGGKEVLFRHYNGYYSSSGENIIVGTMSYADDTTTFTPVDTISGTYDIWENAVVHIPDGCTDRFVAFRGHFLYSNYAYIGDVSISGCQVSNARISNIYGTRAVVAWDAPSGGGDTVIVEYYSSSYYHYYDTVVGVTQHTVTGLQTNTYYYFLVYRPCGESCDLFELSARTAVEDYALPLCEDFENTSSSFFNSLYGWYRYSTHYSCPMVDNERYHSRFHSLKMSSYSGDHYYDIVLPNLEGLGGQVLTFWAQGLAPASEIVLSSWDGQTTIYYNCHPFDTLNIIGDGTWHHYSVTLPATLTQRLTLQYRLSGNASGLYFLWLDDFQVGSCGYGDFTFANLTSHSVDVVWQSVGATAASAYLVSDAGDTLYATGTPDTLHFSGLDSNMHYHCYMAPIQNSDTLCFSYASSFLTPMYSPGGGAGEGDDSTSFFPAACNPFDDLPTGTLPYGWAFSDSTAITLSEGVMTIVPGTTPDTITLPAMPAMALYLAARGLSGNDTLFVDSDTLLLDTTWRYYCHEPATIHPIELRISSGASGGGCQLDNVGFSSCPIVDFIPVGNSLHCNVRGGIESEYLLTLTDNEGTVRTYHVSGSSFTIEGLPPSTDFTARWHCLYSSDDCMPTLSVRTAAIPLPYCVDFSTGGINTLPDGWQTVGWSNDQAYNAGSEFYFYSSYDISWYPEYHRYNTHWQYIIFPEVEDYDNLSLSLYGRIYNNFQTVEVGILTDPSDTSTFISAGTLPYRNDNYYNYTVDLSLLPHGRVAIRNMEGSFYVSKMQLLDAPKISYHLYRYNTLTVEAASRGTYILEHQFTSSSSTNHLYNPTATTVDTSLYLLPAYTSSSSYSYLGVNQADSSGASGCQPPEFFPLHRPAAVPYCENFEDYQNRYGYFYYYRYAYKYWDYMGRSSDYNSETHTYDYLLNYSTSYDYFLSFPYFLVDSVNTLTANFKYRFRSNYGCDTPPYVIAGVLPDALDTAGFVPVDTLFLVDDDNWHTATVDFSTYHGDGHWIALHDPSSCGYHYFYLDDIHVEACHAALQATVTLERHNVVRIDNPVDESFYVEYGPTGFTRGSGTLQAVTSVSHHLTLQPETTYDFYFYCDTTGAPCAQPQTVTTLAPPLSVPLCIDFDTNTVDLEPRSWIRMTGNSVVTDSTSHSGDNALLVLGTVATPDIDIDSLQQMTLGLWVMTTDANTRLVVGAVSNPADPTSFHPLKTIVPEQTGVWEHHFVSFANAPANTHFLALRNSAALTSRTLFVDDLHLATCAAFDMHIDHLDNNNINLSWSQVGSPLVTLSVEDNGSTTNYTLSGTSYALPITPLHNYTLTMHAECQSNLACNVAYDDTIHIVAPVEGIGCVNPTDLQSPQAVFFSGSYQNPYSSAGAIDFGSRSPDSRHTVCYDTTERDPRTGGLLRTIPEGYTSSVRLGNWSTNNVTPEAEGVIYSLMVDTLSFNLLMMRYAAVLQDPMHDPNDQPRFRLELLDSTFNLIDPVCAAADFIANRNLGWNEAADNVLWKDWTPVGIDVAAYAGQQIYVRLTTYDCNEGSHYGYAYFTLECMRKSIDAETCGDVDSNRFTAPNGFNYRWYTATSPTTIGTERSLVVPTADMATYFCDLSFVGNSACSFTLSAYGGPRMPLALADTVVTISDCQFDVQFLNRSTISPDGVNPSPTHEVVETAFWDFGNGETSNNYHGHTVYTTPGTYTVTLIVGISGGACSDTLVWPVVIDFPTHPHIVGPDTLCYGTIDALRLYDGTPVNDSSWTHSGTFWYLPMNTDTYHTGSNLYALTTTDGYGCSPHVSHSLTVNPTYTHMDTVRLCAPMLPYNYADTSFLYGTVDAQYNLDLTTIHGCDSSYHLWLYVSDTNSTTLRDTLMASICDNESYTFFGTSYNQPGTHIQVHVNDEGMCDSIHNLLLDVRATSAVDTFANHCDHFEWHGNDYTLSTTATHLDTNAVLCDSTTTLHLTIRHSTDTVIHHYVIENNLPYLWNGLSFPTDTTDYPHTLQNSQDCDSNISFSLTVYRNTQSTDSRTVCQGFLPFLWNGVVFDLSELDVTTSSITHTATLTTSHGADSVVTMHVNVLRNTSATIDDTLLQNNLATYTPPLPVPVAYHQNENDPALVSLVDTVMVIPNAVGCDSIVHYTLHLWRNYNVADSAHRCDNQLPLLWETLSLSADTVATLTLTSSHGTDSTVSFSFTVHPTFEVGDTILICPHRPYLYEEVDYGGPIDFDSPHLTVQGCDSLVHVSLQPRDSTFRLAPEVSLNQNPWLPYDTTFLGCLPSTLRLRDTSTSVSRTWTFWNADGTGDTLTNTDTLFSTSVDSLGIFSFRLIAISPEGCHDTVMNDSLLWVFSNPVANFNYEPGYLSIHHPLADFQNLSEPDSLTYLWLFPKDAGASSCDSSHEVNPSYEWEQPAEVGEYPVKLIAYLLHHGPDSLTVTCPDTVTIPINIVNTYLQFPNLVTPNGDGINDTWVIVNLLEMSEYSMNELWIYDRWGVLVYHVKNIRRMEDFWDPNDTNSPDGTYYYRFTAKNNFGTVKRNGVIEVSR